MTLYVKYRPTEFSEMVGNEVAIKALQKALEKKNHSHVYMFTGPAGTGKTTLARIMAKHLGASELDIREYNSASNRGIDTAREIQQQMKLYPTAGDVIVYILDESHRWTPDFAHSMLKPFEDTPSHVYFFLCTTDPQKVIKPIKTRATIVNLELLKESQLVTILHRVVKLENLNISKSVYSKIAEVAEGCPRKALVLLEQVASLESEEEQETYLNSGTFSEEDIEIVQLCRKLIDIHANWQHIAKILKQLASDGKLDDAEKVRYAVLGYMNAVLMNGAMSDRVALAIEAFSEPTYNSGKAGITLACVKVMM